MNVQELFLKQKEANRRRTREVVSMIQPAQMAWRPVPGALSAGEMIRHLWVSEQGVLNVVLNRDFTYFEKRIPGGLAAVLGTVESVERERENLERVHQETLAAVGALPLASFDEERSNEALGYRRKIGVILFGLNEHEAHHRAQLMTYLRILGTPVPEAIARR